ncbi:group III truncated hemoglobin [Ochrobactrum vermis]|uniref:Group III truncated hemoglobin n=1 Tax=Ochrobactrum vermis TaxID=1827297 RepID=A0ABU8PL07_9HYPH|nr:group III truncated hemoglobin [Ochrobactrum vermis]PQZ24326.1 preprotein translocase subunit TatC [Ochrobactrum vermis]
MKGREAPQRTILIDGRPLPETLDEAMIEDVIHAFYGRIRDDDLVGPIFHRVIAADQWPRHLASMCDFWSGMLLHTGRYEGSPLPAHLAIPELEEAHFRRWLSLFKQTADHRCPPDVAALFMDRALRVAHSFRLAIAFDRKLDTLTITPITSDSL